MLVHSLLVNVQEFVVVGIVGRRREIWVKNEKFRWVK